MLTLTDCTISGNTAVTAGGGLNNFGTAKLTDTIVAGNTSSSAKSPDDISGNVSGTFNLIGTGGAGGLASGKNHNIILTNLSSLGLAPLGSYGGPTQTMALLPGSAALGTGTAAASVTTDQRGSKLDAPNPDIGAYQSQGFTLTVEKSSTPQSAPIHTAFVEPLGIVVTANDPKEPVAGGVISFTTPSSGASAALSSAATTIGSGGTASVTATANSSVGSYTIAASVPGVGAAADFKLSNVLASSKSVVVPHARYKNKKVVSLSLEAEVEPVTGGAGVPTGTVIFELLQKHKKPKVLGTARLSGGTATLSVRPAVVLNQSIEIIYSGNADFQKSTTTQVSFR
jgi:hypothetical protein